MHVWLNDPVAFFIIEVQIVEIDGICPMCWSEVAVKDIEEIGDPIEDMKVRDSSLGPC